MVSFFIFLSLAFVKRFVELRGASLSGKEGLKGRSYVVGDMRLVGGVGISCGCLAALLMALYVNHPSVAALYLRPQVLWLLCPILLYWISRIWLLAHRGTLSEDPILFTLRDGPSWLIILLIALVGLAAVPK
jgi:hypothetical protein